MLRGPDLAFDDVNGQILPIAAGETARSWGSKSYDPRLPSGRAFDPTPDDQARTMIASSPPSVEGAVPNAASIVEAVESIGLCGVRSDDRHDLHDLIGHVVVLRQRRCPMTGHSVNAYENRQADG
jgi:hypothetical protein